MIDAIKFTNLIVLANSSQVDNITDKIYVILSNINHFSDLTAKQLLWSVTGEKNAIQESIDFLDLSAEYDSTELMYCFACAFRTFCCAVNFGHARKLLLRLTVAMLCVIAVVALNCVSNVPQCLDMCNPVVACKLYHFCMS